MSGASVVRGVLDGMHQVWFYICYCCATLLSKEKHMLCFIFSAPIFLKRIDNITVIREVICLDALHKP